MDLSEFKAFVDNKLKVAQTGAITKCDLIPLASALTETSILYTHRQADSSIPPKTFIGDCSICRF